MIITNHTQKQCPLSPGKRDLLHNVVQLFILKKNAETPKQKTNKYIANVCHSIIVGIVQFLFQVTPWDSFIKQPTDN
jgi:hypothetical protein